MKCFFTFYKHRVGKIATKSPREEWNEGTHLLEYFCDQKAKDKY